MLDVIIQGPIYQRTEEVIESYRSSNVNKIIYSGWENDIDITLSKDIYHLKNKKPNFTGRGNLNYQLLSSYKGFLETTSSFVLKTRSDLIIEKAILESLENFLISSNNTQSNLPLDKIIVLYINKTFPFFTNDFLYFGRREDIQVLLSADQVNSTLIIPESYIAATYISNYEEEVKTLCKCPESNFVEGRPGFKHCVELSPKFMLKYFKQLPNISICWTKKMKEFRDSYSLVGMERLT